MRFVEVVLVRCAAQHDHVALRVGLEGRERFANDLVHLSASLLAADRAQRAMGIGGGVLLDLLQQRGDGVADGVVEDGMETLPTYLSKRGKTKTFFFRHCFFFNLIFYS